MNIIITGASKGIGKQIAVDLAAEHVHLLLIARNEDLLNQTKDLCLAKKAKVSCFYGSINDSKLISDIDQFNDSIDVLINAAGLGYFNDFEKLREAEIDEMIQTNIKGTFQLTQTVVKKMKEAQKGLLINLISDVGKRVEEKCSFYAATKHAQDAFFTTLRKEVRIHKIKVSNIYTGLVDTEFHELPQGSDEYKDWLKVEDVAATVNFIIAQKQHVSIDEIMMHPMCQKY